MVLEPVMAPLINDPKSWDLQRLDNLLQIPFNIPTAGFPGLFSSPSSDSYPPPDWCAIPEPENLEVIDTQYDPLNKNNHFPIRRPKNPNPGSKGKKRDRDEVAREKLKYKHNAFKLTEKLRRQASKAESVQDIVQLRKKVCRTVPFIFISFLIAFYLAELDPQGRLSEKRNHLVFT